MGFIEMYKKQLIDLKSRVDREKEAKKKDNERYAQLIKNASSPSTKASYRKQKIDRAASHDNTIQAIKRQMESIKASLARERERAKKKK